MRITLSLPARVNILGNPSDGNEGDFATISAAVELRAHAILEPADKLLFVQTDADSPAPQAFPCETMPLPLDGNHDLLKGALNRLHAYSAEYREKARRHGVCLAVRSDVPRQSGLGGSSLFILLALAGLRELYDLDRHLHNDYVLAELAQRVECHDMGIAGGFSDRYVPLFGGLAYLDYRGKLHQKGLGAEPYTTYERLDRFVSEIPLVAAMTGVRHDSGNVHGRMRPRYLEEHAIWQANPQAMPAMVRFMSAAYETAWRGKIALLEGDLPTFGALMNQNHRLVDEMMRYCGFMDGAGWANNLFIETALENGALGAKLTGAGGGGSVFALTEPGEQEKVMKAWQEIASEKDLKEARIFRLQIAHQGLVVTR